MELTVVLQSKSILSGWLSRIRVWWSSALNITNGSSVTYMKYLCHGRKSGVKCTWGVNAWCMTAKSSKRVVAAGYIDESFAGLCIKHFTASM
jgi:hypothetical protein